MERPDHGLEDVDKLIYNYSLETFRFLYTILVSIISILFTVYIALVGIAIKEDMQPMLWLAAFVPFLMLSAAVAVRQHISPYICMAVSIERKYAIDDGMMITYIRSVFGDKAFHKVDSALKNGGCLGENVRIANRNTLPDFARYSFKFVLAATVLHLLLVSLLLLRD